MLESRSIPSLTTVEGGDSKAAREFVIAVVLVAEYSQVSC